MALLVTFHGGKPTKSIPDPIQYVAGYAQVFGVWLSNTNLLDMPKPADKHNELRDVKLASDGNLYVVNSYKDASVIWQIPSGGLTKKQSPQVFTGASIVPSIDHPFAVAFDSQMTYCYISNQDTNVVVRVYGSGSKCGQAAPINGSIPGSDFLPGTFVASQLGILPPGDSGPAPSGVPSKDGGLAYSPSSGPPLSNSVRGVAVIGSMLYVADEVGDCVRLYDTGTGKYQKTLNDPNGLITGPVHLLASGTMLYITSASQNGSVLSYDTTGGTGTSNTSLRAIITGITTPSGLTQDSRGNLYVASRTGQYINLYTYNSENNSYTPSPGNPVLDSGLLVDQPEFVLWVE
jgi:hypothetical protein